MTAPRRTADRARTPRPRRRAPVAPVTVVVSHCLECPFCYDGRDAEDRVRCTAVDLGHEFRPIAIERLLRLRPVTSPRWCPLRRVDHTVTFRRPEDPGPDGAASAGAATRDGGSRGEPA